MIVRRKGNHRHVAAVAALLVGLAFAAGCGRSQEESSEATDPLTEYEKTNFTAQPDAKPFSGPTPFTTTFSAEIKNPTGTVKYLWDFNDGSPRTTEESPTHTFTKPGLYTVGLQATDASGEVDGGSVIVRAMTDEEVKAVQEKAAEAARRNPPPHAE